MKRSIIDRVVGVFSPTAEIRRLQGKQAREVMVRGYDAAKDHPTSDWVSASKSGANAEISLGQKVLQQRSHELARNSAYTTRALNVIVSNTVGAGIVPNIKGKKSQVKKLNLLWKLVAETPLCDAEGVNNFYGLQALYMRSIAQAGEGLALKLSTPIAPSIKMLESDFIVSKKDEGNVIQGIEVDKATGKRVKYYLYQQHPGEKGANENFKAVPADQVAHAFKQDRPGQVRGVPWATPVIETIKDLADYQNATIIGKKVAACFVGVITSNKSDSALPAADLKARREAELQMNPGTWRYADDAAGVHFSNPPSSGGYAEFVRESLKEISAGFGISYEAMSGDYSNVNFSSGRMGHQEFRRNIEYWRWNILIPHFCDRYFAWFLEWSTTQGVDPTGVTVEWVPPAHVMIDPVKEINALKNEVRNGFKTYGQAVREQGLDPDEVLTETAEWNKKLDDLKITLDTDPRRMAGVGFAHPKDTLPLLNSDAEELQPNEVDTSGQPANPDQAQNN